MINYTQHIEQVCIDICKKVPQLQHIDPTRIAYSVANGRKNAARRRIGAMVGCLPKPGSIAEQLGIKPQRLKDAVKQDCAIHDEDLLSLFL